MFQNIKKCLTVTAAVLSVAWSTAVYAGEMVNMKLFYDGKAHNYKAEEIKININGTQLTGLDLPPVSIDDRTMVPARAVFEALGAELFWNEETKEVYVTKDNDIIVLQIDKKTGSKNGVEFSMDTGPKIINDWTTVPVRAVSEAMGCIVEWDAASRNVIIYEQNSLPPTVETPVEIPNDTITQPPDVTPPVVTPPTEPVTPPASVTGNEISVNSISIPNSAGDVQNFVINASGAIEKFEDVFVDNNRIVIDIYHASMGVSNTNIEVSTSPFVSAVRSAQNQVEPQKITRIVLDLKSPVKYSLTQSADKKSIIVGFTQNTLTSVRFRNQNGIDYVDIEGSASLITNVSTLMNPNRVVIDVPYTTTQLNGSLNYQGAEFITNAQISQYNEKTVRIVLNVSIQPEFSVTQNGNAATVQLYKSTIDNMAYDAANKTIMLNKKQQMNIGQITHTDNYLMGQYKLTLPGDYKNVYGYGTYQIDDAVLNNFTIQNDTLGNTVFTFSQKQIMAYDVTEDSNYYYIKALNPKQKYDKIVFIDAGHGGNDPGTNGNGLTEKELNLDVALRVYHLLNQNNSIKTYITRVDDSRPANAERANISNQTADMFVSIHMNSADSNTAKNPVPNGTETLYKVHSNDTGEKLTSQMLASVIQKHMLSALGTNNRGLKERDDLLVLNQTKIPAVIVETVFLSNPGDALKISEDANKQAAAQAIYDAIVEVVNNYKLR